jgi:ABC-type antimicrobial peptide transport system permease subunit
MDRLYTCVPPPIRVNWARRFGARCKRWTLASRCSPYERWTTSWPGIWRLAGLLKELLGVFAAVAFLLAAICIYGVMAYTFSRRTGEIGLRMALGAQRIDILIIVLGEGALMVVFGVAAGLIGSAMLTRFLQTMLFEIKPTDPITFGVLTTLLVSVALLACLIPAQRATRVDPLMALRHE